MRKPVRFDDSLPVFIDLICDAWGESAVSQNVFLRDATGRLTFVVVDDQYDGEARAALADHAVKALGSYTDADGFAVATADELFDDSLKNRDLGWKIPISTKRFSGNVHVVDRRVVGADWLRTPASTTGWPPRIVFSSLKGGVGRSTALCVLAAHLAGMGKRVLTIDMDLEAPGLGNMLLSDDTLPEFGLLDFLVETAVNPVDDDFYVDMVGHSWLGGGRGTVDVIPALGLRSLTHPVNVLAKIARAYLEQPSAGGGATTVTDRMSKLLEYFTERDDYDAILIDARAGLHETTAAAILGLGAEVMLFGIDQPQTFSAYGILFAHITTLPGQDWRERLHMVQAKAPRDDQVSREAFSLKMKDLMKSYLWPSEIEVVRELAPEDFQGVFEIEWEDNVDDVVMDEDTGDVDSVVAIGESPDYQVFDPAHHPDSLTESIYGATFGAFLEKALSLIAPDISHDTEGQA